MTENEEQNPSQNQIPNEIKLEIINNWPSDEIVKLYKAGGWWHEEYDSKGIPALITGSFAFLIAVNTTTNHAIGMGRVISDGVSDSYIQDVVVLPEFRSKGIGKAIIQRLLEHCINNKLLWIGLVAEPGTKEFYKHLGFTELPGEPLVYQPRTETDPED